MIKDLSVTFKEIVEEFKLEVLYSPYSIENIHIKTADVNRPGLQLAGFYEYYDNSRIQIAGKAEFAYMEQKPIDERVDAFDDFFSTKPPVFIVTRGMEIFPEIYTVAAHYEVPLFRSASPTSEFTAKLIHFLGIKLAPRITRHGVLIEVYGEGVLIIGDSGVGKSEAAIELVKRGHRLVADDAVEIRRTSDITLVGSSPDNIRHFLELRGIGIINARQLFGMGAIKIDEEIDLVAGLELWDSSKMYDRMGVDNRFISILGVKVPHVTIPVKPGRNIAVILEVAAMNNRQKKMGYNAAQDLLERLGTSMEPQDEIVDFLDESSM
ncbi:MAG: HPr(Ser) kinase/phosphatase [Oscillospiraceae bacterium]|jgi:HPr kinase/phosphorylase|nr:HPr(Ser) kinase/phosphatase [Oscillospiraceae bacterium]